MVDFTSVRNFKDFEAVRRIYNESLHHMTKPLTPNTLEEQMDWWLSTDRGDVSVGKVADVVVGFVVVKRQYWYQCYGSGGFSTPMFAIATEHQGKGYAREFIQFYLRKANGPMVGEQRTSNEVIRRLNAEAGWEIMAVKDGVEFLFHPGNYAYDCEKAAQEYIDRRTSEL